MVLPLPLQVASLPDRRGDKYLCSGFRDGSGGAAPLDEFYGFSGAPGISSHVARQREARQLKEEARRRVEGPICVAAAPHNAEGVPPWPEDCADPFTSQARATAR